MSYMFYKADNIEIDLSLFNSKNVEDMRRMFYHSRDLRVNPLENDSKLLNLSFLDTSSVTNMNYMFEGSKFTNIDLSNFNTKSVRDMSYMFSECSNLTSLDLSTFNIEKV